MDDASRPQGDVAAIVLAAGRSTRFGAGQGTSKVVAMLNGRPLVAHVVAAAQASRASPILIVTGQAAAAAESALAGLRNITLVNNEVFASGMASSLQLGLVGLPPSASGALIMLADMPLVTSATLDRLIETFERGGRPNAVVPCFEGRQGNPVLISRTLFPLIMGLSGDQGARRILIEAEGVVRCPVEDAGVLTDIDTQAALAAVTLPL